MSAHALGLVAAMFIGGFVSECVQRKGWVYAAWALAWQSAGAAVMVWWLA